MAGLTLVSQTEHGCNFEFWGSEMYRRGYNLYEPSLERDRTAVDLFPARIIEQFNIKSAAANAAGRGGRVAMVFRV